MALFFFFQAEDGIRDWSVTGVQTCALPIYYLAEDCWGRLSFDLSGLLYNLSFKEGDKIKKTENGVTTIINVDGDYLDGQYQLLQNLLEEHQKKRFDEYQRMQNEVNRKYGS